MYKVEFYKKAKFQYLWIWEYIARDNPFYANEVLDKIDHSIEIILIFPFIWKEIRSWYRQIVEPNYKFKIIYKVKWDTIYIVWLYREQKNWN
jgi:hypothetical protein